MLISFSFFSSRQIMINIVVKSGLALHKALVQSMMNAPIQLFAEVDSGVIVNLFSQDMTIVDAVLPTMAFGTILGKYGIAFLGCTVTNHPCK
jgi:hypothetical protein